MLDLERELFPEDAWSAGHVLVRARGPATPGPPPVHRRRGPGRRIAGYAGLMAVAAEGDVQTIAVTSGTGERAGAGCSPGWCGGREAGCDGLLLEVRVDNARAQRLYERFGFDPVGIRRSYYQPIEVDALVMRLEHPSGDVDPNDV